jgi:hypothetical protein
MKRPRQRPSRQTTAVRKEAANRLMHTPIGDPAVDAHSIAHIVYES